MPVSCDGKLVKCDRKLASCDRKLVSCDRKLVSCDGKNRCVPYDEPPYARLFVRSKFGERNSSKQKVIIRYGSQSRQSYNLSCWFA